MITWMQTHRKWLVIIMWISVISFVGAGAVGWGSYDYNKSSNTVATVGDKEITYKEFQSEYSRVYGYYSKMFGKQFNQEMAKQFGLEKQAYNNLIQQFLLLNFADEFGIVVSDQEIATEIQNIESFKLNNIFHKDTYIKVLSANNIKIADFENDIKKNIILKKVYAITKIDPNENEKNAINLVQNISDRVSILTLSLNDINVDMSDKKLKNFWNNNKNSYKTIKEYNVSILDISTLTTKDSDDILKSFYKDNITDFNNKKFDDIKQDVQKALNNKKTKKEANKLFYILKKGDNSNAKKISINANSLKYSYLLKKLSNSIEGDTLKPIKSSTGYSVVKVDKIVKPKTKKYEDALMQLKVDYVTKSKHDGLIKLAKSRVMVFKGQDIGYVNKATTTIKDLNQNDTQIFISKLFKSNKKRGYVPLSDKAILFDIIDQKLDTITSVNSNNILRIKADLLNNALQNYLKTKYSVENYINLEG